MLIEEVDVLEIVGAVVHKDNPIWSLEYRDKAVAGRIPTAGSSAGLVEACAGPSPTMKSSHLLLQIRVVAVSKSLKLHLEIREEDVGRSPKSPERLRRQQSEWL